MGVLACDSEAVSPSVEVPDFPELEELDRTPDPGCSATWIAAATGRVVDTSGLGLAAARAQLCIHTPETFVCLAPPETDPEGWFARVIEPELRCVERIGIRALVPGGMHATTYCQLPRDPADSVLHLAEPVVVHELPPAVVPEEGDPDAERAVTFGDGLAVNVVPSALGASYAALRGARVALDDPPCFVGDAALIALYAFAPERTTGPTGFGLSIPNHAALEDGTEVELLVLGGLETIRRDGTQVEVATLEPFGTARVRGDQIVSDPGSELPYLSWFGYRRR